MNLLLIPPLFAYPIRCVPAAVAYMAPEFFLALHPDALSQVAPMRGVTHGPGRNGKDVGIRPHWSRSICATAFVKRMVFMLIPALAQHLAWTIFTQ